MKKALIASLIAFILCVFGVTALYAQSPARKSARPPEVRSDQRVALTLSEEKEAQLKTAREAKVKNMEKFRLELKEADLAIEKELAKDKPNMKTVRSLVDKKAKVIANMEYANIEYRQNLKTFLTDEEIAQVAPPRRNGEWRMPMERAAQKEELKTQQ